MQLKTFWLIGAALGVVYGIGFLLVPDMILQIYGAKGTPETLLGYRYFAVGLLTAGLMCWAVRDCRDPSVVQPLLLGHGIADVAGIAVSLWGTLTGIIGPLGWMNVALYVALAAGCIYFYRSEARTVPLAA